MMKWLLLLAVIALVMWWTGAGRNARQAQVRQAARRRAAPEAMVACAHCGVHLPRGEAVADGQALFCSAAHRQLGVRPQ
jgi:uncharacterized protein